MPSQLTSVTDLVSLLWQRAEHAPEKTAYVFLDPHGEPAGRLTYSELAQRSAALASMLCEREVREQPVLLVHDAGLDFLIAFFATLQAGAIAVPVCPPRRTSQRNEAFRSIAVHCGARLALTTARLSEDPVRKLASYVDGLEWLSSDVALPPTSTRPSCAPSEVALLQYTSGSTSRSKGTIITHQNILANERMVSQAFGQTDQTVFVGWLPHYHDMGLIGNLLQPFYVGGCCVFMAPETFVQNPVRWLEAITRHRGTTAGGPNFAYQMCVDRVNPTLTPLDLSSWELAFVGAEPVRLRTLEAFADKFAGSGFRREALYPCYGMAEATLFVSGNGKGEGYTHSLPQSASGALVSSDQRLVSCGRSWGTSIRVVQPETGIALPAGEIGEVWLQGACVSRGYWRAPELSEQLYGHDRQGERWLRTGDLGYFDGEQLVISGRIKNIVIVGGKNYHAEDIEQVALAREPALSAVAAFAVPTETGEKLAAVCELRGDASSADYERIASDLRAEVFTRLSVTPGLICFVRNRTLPRTTSGKVKHAECRESLLHDRLRELSRSETGPRTLTQRVELELWLLRQIGERIQLAPERIGCNTPFPSLGLESRDLLALTSLLGERLQTELDAALLWEYPTVGELVAYLSRQLAPASPAARSELRP